MGEGNGNHVGGVGWGDLGLYNTDSFVFR